MAPPALMDELVEEILLRIPPDDPARLLRAALVCKCWCRVASDPGFRRRFCEFHRTPPMLGFLWNGGHPASPRTCFLSTSSFRPSPAQLYYTTIDARHGRVLLHGSSWNKQRKHWEHYLVVWDPITRGELARLPLLPDQYFFRYLEPGTWNAAVLCASAAVDGACDHLDCHTGPFLVVSVARGRRWDRCGMSAQVYSSEAARWSQRINAPYFDEHMLLVPSALAGNSLYFLCSQSVLKFDVATREMRLIDLPQETFGRRLLRATEDGGLGLATVCSDGICLWSREIGPDEDVVWAQSQVIKLAELLRAEAAIPDGPLGSPLLIGSAHGLVIVNTSVGIFAIHLKPVRVTKLCGKSWFDRFTFPYICFYTPSIGSGRLCRVIKNTHECLMNIRLSIAALSVKVERDHGSGY